MLYFAPASFVWGLDPPINTVGISYWPDLAVKDHILDECLGSAAGPWSEEIRGALSYVVACIVKAGPSPSTQDRIVDLAGKWKTRLSIGCILCQLARDFDAQRLESVWTN
jgi:hypothetical protein